MAPISDSTLQFMVAFGQRRCLFIATAIFCLTGLVILVRAREHSPKNAQAGRAIETVVQEEIASNQVAIFSKSYCPYCMRAKALFKEMGVPFKAIELDIDERGGQMKQYLISFTNQHTVPNIFINGVHVGGFDQTLALKGSGKLEAMLSKKLYDEL